MKLVITSVASLFLSALSAQISKKEIPSAVKETFKKEFPAANAKWETEPNGYEAEFKLQGVEASANYDATGHRTEFEIEIKPSALPASALNYIKEKYPSQKISEAAKITDDKNTVTYEAEVKTAAGKKDILFDAKGNFIK